MTDTATDKDPLKQRAKPSSEERKLLAECKRNAFIYRGLPAGIACFAVVNTFRKAGYLKKHGQTVMLGSITVGSILGYFSYMAGPAVEKFLSLPNSTIGDQLREQRRILNARAGIPVPEKEKSEFDDAIVVPDENVSILSDDSNVSMQSKQEIGSTSRQTQSSVASNGSKWDEIRSKSRQEQDKTRTSNGSRWEEIRRQSRSGQGEYSSLTPEEEEVLERKLSLATSPEPNVEANDTSKKNYRKTVQRTNQYGDDVA